MYKKIGVAIDGSNNSKRAAEHAAHFASFSKGAIVELIYVLEYDRTHSDVISNAGRDDLHVDRERQIALIEEVFEKRNISHKLVIQQGDPGPAIVNYVNKGEFDLVVIGSRGLNSFQEMVLGSVSHKVAKQVKAPVLIVK